MDSYRYVILGGGMVAGYTAQEMAERGLEAGALAIVSADTALPYERPPLSKGLLTGTNEDGSIFINDEAFYTEHGIAVRLGTAVERVDTATRRLQLRGGDEIEYERLLIATGANPRMLEVPGADLDGVLYLRSLDDSKRIRAYSESRSKAVVIGSGFIGMEVASSLRQRGLEVTMVFPDERVWQRFFTPEMSAFFQRYYEARGVAFAPGERVGLVEGEAGVASGVVLESGGRLDADLIVAGVGVTPVTEFLAGSGIEVDNGVLVNEYLETSAPGVLAAGDVANYHDVLFNKRRRVEHWDNAVEQGKHAARVLMGERAEWRHVPYFFSDVFDLSYEFWGDTQGSSGQTEAASQVVYRGDVASGSFSTWWLREGRVVAAFVLNRPDFERDAAPALIEQGRPLPDRFEDA